VENDVSGLNRSCLLEELDRSATTMFLNRVRQKVSEIELVLVYFCYDFLLLAFSDM